MQCDYSIRDAYLAAYRKRTNNPDATYEDMENDLLELVNKVPK